MTFWGGSGWVASLEPGPAVDLYHPANPAWDRLHEIFIAAVQADGVDPFIGRRLPELFREAGLSDIGVRAHAELYPPGHTRRTIRLDLVRRMRPRSCVRKAPSFTSWLMVTGRITVDARLLSDADLAGVSGLDWLRV